MSFFHHGTIRKYTGAILQYFNDLEVQYARSTGELITKKVPLKYSSREKTKVFDEVTSQQLLEGNYNVLPRASLAFISLNKSEQRTTNKNNKINLFNSEDSVEYSFNSVPYEFLYDIVVQCRGMTEATQIIEQVCANFNPIVNIDVWDVQNLTEPTRIPLTLQGTAIEGEEYEEITSNILTCTFSLSLFGSLYQPIQSLPKIKEFKMYLHEIQSSDTAQQQWLGEWDVQDGDVQDGDVQD